MGGPTVHSFITLSIRLFATARRHLLFLVLSIISRPAKSLGQKAYTIYPFTSSSLAPAEPFSRSPSLPRPLYIVIVCHSMLFALYCPLLTFIVGISSDIANFVSSKYFTS